MKVFDRDGRINFVDDNNVFVGFNNRQDCCERFDASIREHPQLNAKIVDGIKTKDECEEYPGFNFDTTFYTCPHDEHGKLENGNAVAFRLTNGQAEVFLVLKNSHNGYYSHGFEMKNGDRVLFDGSI